MTPEQLYEFQAGYDRMWDAYAHLDGDVPLYVHTAMERLERWMAAGRIPNAARRERDRASVSAHREGHR